MTHTRPILWVQCFQTTLPGLLCISVTVPYWNILIGELDSTIDSYVPMKKQGKRSKKKRDLSKEAFRKIRYTKDVTGL